MQSSRAAFANVDEQVTNPPKRSSRAITYAYSSLVVKPTRPAAAISYAYSNQVVKPTHSVQAIGYAYANLVRLPVRPAAALVYAYEHTVPTANPARLYVWDPAQGEYVREPWYYFDRPSGTWKPVY